MNPQEKKRFVLVLGGSNFMGKSLLWKLSSRSDLYEIHYINRKKKYWNNEIESIPNIRYTFGDRRDYKDFAKLLAYMSKKLGISENPGDPKWECVVDFCGYKSNHVKSIFKGLKNLCILYIFISTDSIYDVCDTKIRTSEFIQEDFDIRPRDAREAEQKIKNESYGHKKLKCEEFLKSLNANYSGDKFPFISLRLPDVIGPYDSTARYWCYLKWIDEYGHKPVELEKEDMVKKISLVYSEDVVDLIFDLISKVTKGTLEQKIINRAFNLSFREIFTLNGLLQMISSDLNRNATIIETNDIKTFYPSVDCGPLNIERALKDLQWNPTELKVAINTTNKFFKNVRGMYETEEREVYDELRKKTKLF